MAWKITLEGCDDHTPMYFEGLTGEEEKFLMKLIALKKEDENSTKNALTEYEQKKKEYEEEYNEELKEYETKLKSHNLLKDKFIEDYKNWRAIYLESLVEEAEITEQLEKDEVAGIEKIDAEEYQPILIKLAEAMNGVLSNNYLNQVDTLIEYLKSGRADNLKEAIEVYEEELFRKKELQILREQEAQRQYESKKEKESQKEIKKQNSIPKPNANKGNLASKNGTFLEM